MINNNRILIVDALRGFALLGIVLIHSVEHFDFFYPPQINLLFSAEFDAKIMDLVFLLISGKAYSIFALMFGISFFIQMERNKQRGIDFSKRFLWRLTILFIFGFIHSLFYEGDILHIYALLGFPLIIFNKFSNKTLLITALLLFVQIPLFYHLVNSLIYQNYVYKESLGSGLWEIGAKTYATGNLIDVIKYNNWNGRIAVWGWTIYNGRILQLIGLFLVGLILGRRKFFNNLETNKGFLIKSLIFGLIAAMLLGFISTSGVAENLTETSKNIFGKVLQSYTNLVYTGLIIIAFCLINLKFKDATVFRLLSNFGRMSLSNYLFQSLIGVTLFYNFGFGLYRYLGSTWSLIYGIIFVSLQIAISNFWFKHFHYGPFEWLWRAITYFDFNLKFRK